LLGQIAGLTNDLIIAMGWLAIDNFNPDLSNCLNEDIASSPAIAARGLGAKMQRSCTPAASPVIEIPRPR
jgi:hypothetical protein